jgi:hypothetical protein
VIRALLIATAATLCAAVGVAAPPLAGSWNITPSGSAASSGDLLFRVTSGDRDPVEITVPVHSGSSDVAVARNIRQALSSQLPRNYRVELGEGANVLISDSRGKPSFSIELIDSDIDNMRVAVRNIEPGATPTVPAQATPATTQPPSTPPQPGAATPPTQNPANSVPPANTPQPQPTPEGAPRPGSTPPGATPPTPPGTSPSGASPPNNSTPPPESSPSRDGAPGTPGAPSGSPPASAPPPAR